MTGICLWRAKQHCRFTRGRCNNRLVQSKRKGNVGIAGQKGYAVAISPLYMGQMPDGADDKWFMRCALTLGLNYFTRHDHHLFFSRIASKPQGDLCLSHIVVFISIFVRQLECTLFLEA